MGGDRAIISLAMAVLVLLGYAVWVAFGMLHGLTFGVPIALMGFVVVIARKLFAADPHMLGVLLRHLQYKPYYAPTRGIHAAPRSYPPFSDS